MKRILLIGLVALVLVAGGAYAYTQRVAIGELFDQTQRPDVPAAVSYEQVQQETAAPTSDETEEERVEHENDTEETEDDTTDAVEETEQDTQAQDIEDDTSIESDSDTQPDTVTETEAETDASADLPAEINLAVPFTPQAPHANWEQPYADACEEASLYMAHLYYDGEQDERIDADTADAALLKLVEFQNSIFGFYKDTTAEQTGILAEKYYGYSRVETIDNPTIEDIKRHLAAGRPVIVPMAGQELANPYYTAPGPLYHMLVVRGYTKNGFITNDPGTRRGEAYVYDYDHFMASIHDYREDEDMQKGKKVVLVVYPESQ